MASLVRLRVVNPMTYFADIKAVAVSRFSSSSLLLRLSVAVARIIELVAVPSLSSSSLLVFGS